MTQIDRYLLKLQLRPFVFFSLVFIGILWLVQSLPRLDDIISNGQSGDVFVKVAFNDLWIFQMLLSGYCPPILAPPLDIVH